MSAQFRLSKTQVTRRDLIETLRMEATELKMAAAAVVLRADAVERALFDWATQEGFGGDLLPEVREQSQGAAERLLSYRAGDPALEIVR